jgi:glucuronate isomerase
MHLNGRDEFVAWLARLEGIAASGAGSFPSLLASLRERFDVFSACGCTISDHGLEWVPHSTCSDEEGTRILERLRQGSASSSDLEAWRGRLLRELACWYREKRWTMLLHLGASRNLNRRVAVALGRDAGCDAIGDRLQGSSLASFLDALDSAGNLPSTVLFNSNPRDTALFATIAGSFFSEGAPRVQLGAPWWFLDHRSGIESWMETVAAVGVLGVSLGMVADSRSLLSMTRHEYFRRIIRTRLESWWVEGRIDKRQVDLDEMCDALFVNNARRHFGWGTS